MKFPSSGLYAITQTEEKTAECTIKEVHASIKAGAAVIQYRDKTPDDAVYLAKELLKLCTQYKVPLIINDDVDLALQVGAHGVHIGKHDGDIFSARNRLGSNAIIGMSCYNDINIARQAQANGVDYVAFGRFFPSDTKPLALPAQIDTLEQAKKSINVPIVAIGGILPDNGQQLLAAGANVLAVIGGIFDNDPEQATLAYLKLFNQ